jgi:poly(ADP-ribose) glycohydrolase
MSTSNIAGLLLFPHQLPTWPLKRDALRRVAQDGQSISSLADVFPSYSVIDYNEWNVHLSFMAKTALEVEELFPGNVDPLLADNDREITFTQRECISILSNAFFGTFGECQFEGQRFTLEHWDDQPEKMKCFERYLVVWQKRLQEDSTYVGSKVSFIRRSKPSTSLEDIFASRQALCPVTVFSLPSDAIEKATNCLQADFANEYIGGGALFGGCVQEEIRFVISPECLVSMLLCDRMGDFESIAIRGTEQYR